MALACVRCFLYLISTKDTTPGVKTGHATDTALQGRCRRLKEPLSKEQATHLSALKAPMESNMIIAL
ncbi:hypothetical protein BN341_15500 [Helicobacter heilmannii ASB1.4]|uniref:Uncharacterized protein n=1 Tax=Helicobacter heilmannii TaxID=35817 RepID=A0A0K2YBP1_HELHE|nr:hypothetical protein BN341_15500 [Helicobacter heilmannii ASB1.4]CRI35124.1 hypothetical protein HHE01_01220 [Helicobacter heilmannii]